jgi:hypothetical protein
VPPQDFRTGPGRGGPSRSEVSAGTCVLRQEASARASSWRTKEQWHSPPAASLLCSTPDVFEREKKWFNFSVIPPRILKVTQPSIRQPRVGVNGPSQSRATDTRPSSSPAPGLAAPEQRPMLWMLWTSFLSQKQHGCLSLPFRCALA